MQKADPISCFYFLSFFKGIAQGYAQFKKVSMRYFCLRVLHFHAWEGFLFTPIRFVSLR